jgi:hypothetical protein
VSLLTPSAEIEFMSVAAVCREDTLESGHNCSVRKTSESVQLYVCCSHLTEEAPMVSILKVVGVLSCGFLLCMGLSYAVQAGDAASATTADYTRTVPSSMSSP